MLTPYDDLPIHQLATTLDHVASSDPRWFDRYWFVAYDEQGRLALATGLGVYKNTGVVDGFASVVRNGVQRNIRASRALRPDFAPSVGPLRIEVIEGLRTFRLVCEETTDLPVAFDLRWDAGFDAFEEQHHFKRVAGVVVEDYRRFYQHGRASGTVTAAGNTVSGEFWSFRDRSFGVRPGMGGPMPPSAADALASDTSGGVTVRSQPSLTFGGAFATAELSGVCTFAEAADGSLLALDGRTIRRDGGTPDAFTAVSHELAFHPNGVVRSGELEFGTESGTTISLTFSELMAPLAYVGFGYLDGFDDGLGLGAYRGPRLMETDSYDVSDVCAIRDRSQTRQFGAFTLLDQPLRITIDGRPGCMEGVGGLRRGHHKYRLGT
ncbi:hypothetical protein [Mycobacterium sp.]|uniref:hypothetical protein n=1 Tax=Mycobacterium sp. TaxID=1785 RepID=UPI0012116E07|nr:hypothetical protein [Mycobacterium sp.]TAM64458.1 MAG: hypothetical protein EPN51_23495 [Mycobacterium sp.]